MVECELNLNLDPLDWPFVVWIWIQTPVFSFSNKKVRRRRGVKEESLWEINRDEEGEYLNILLSHSY
jgi:hypothetical protein